MADHPGGEHLEKRNLIPSGNLKREHSASWERGKRKKKKETHIGEGRTKKTNPKKKKTHERRRNLTANSQGKKGH